MTARNPSVRDGEVVSFMGIRLVASHGHPVGALSVMDQRPRQWSPLRIDVLLLAFFLFVLLPWMMRSMSRSAVRGIGLLFAIPLAARVRPNGDMALLTLFFPGFVGNSHRGASGARRLQTRRDAHRCPQCRQGCVPAQVAAGPLLAEALWQGRSRSGNMVEPPHPVACGAFPRRVGL